ncbi:hypothetical protein C2S51_005416 [Perilla frutescens var. frutescens]|nr:hypothetical protein C2S51_005416 [Perilla frutescens var. frutescens]
MQSRKRKPLSDITDIYNLTPLSDLCDRVASNGISKSILKPNSSSTNHKFAPESSDRSNTSIGSSSAGATVQFRHPSPAVSPGDIRIKALVSTLGNFKNRRKNIEYSKEERDAHGISSHASVEKRKDRGNAIAVPFSSSASEKMKDTQNKICNVALTGGGMGIENGPYDRRRNTEKSRKERESDVSACHTSIMKRMEKGKGMQNIEKSRKERESDVSVCHTSIMNRMDKGKAIAMPYSSSPTGKLKDTLNNVCHSSTLVERSSQQGVRDMGFSSGSVEKVKETNKDMLASCSHSSGKTEKGKANLSSSHRALGKKSEIGKDILDTSCCSLEKINDEKKGILKRRSSILQIKEIGEEYLSPSSTLVGGAKDRGKSVDTLNSLPDKTKRKGKMVLEPSNIIGSSAAVAVKYKPSRETSEKNKNAVGLPSCPPMMRIKKTLNDLDEAGNVKYVNLGTDLQANGRKKRCLRSEETIELPEDFIREQKAYYDDVDNFELPVEEVSGDELD